MRFEFKMLVVLGVVIATTVPAIHWSRSLYFTVSDNSMAPSFPNGTRTGIDRQAFRQKNPSYGQVIVFRPPSHDAGDKKSHHLDMKRILAMGGDTVEIRGKKVLINGLEIHESYVQNQGHQISMSTSVRDEFGPIEIPYGHLFVLGDNRDESVDSRSYGPVPITNVVGAQENPGRPVVLLGLRRVL